jgi:hypothetical protein
MPLDQIQDILGHGSPVTTKLIYVDVAEDMYREALDQLGALFEETAASDVGVKRGGQRADRTAVALTDGPGSGASRPAILGIGVERARRDSNPQPLDP